MNILLLGAGIACSALAQVALKFSARFASWGWKWIFAVAAGATLYGVSFLVYAFLLRKEDLSKLSPIMTSAVMLIVVAAGTFLFGERMTARRGLGIALGIGAIALLAW
jgi:drug/metabolite transporter (DMT)-like permease